MCYDLQPDGKVVGRVIPTSEFSVPLKVLAPATRAMAEAELRNENATPFDLGIGPLIRARLLNHAYTAGATLVVTMHHAVGDAWSQDVFMRDLHTAYLAALASKQPLWEPLPIQYADFSAWQQAQLAGQAGAELKAYWRGALAGAPTLLNLPLDHPRSAQPSYVADTVRCDLPEGLLEALEATAKHLHVNTLAVMLAALQAVLLRYSGGQNDLVVGVPVAGRDRPETQRLVGYFVQALPVRCEVPDGSTLADMARNASKATLGALSHSLLPLQHVVAASGIERMPGANPLFQVRFGWRGPR